MINVILTTPAEHLAQSLQGREGIRVILSGKNKEGANRFPDGEVYTRIEGIEKGTRTVVIHAGAPHPNRGMVELEMTLEILRQAGVGEREVFFTYFPYGMQDRVFQEGEVNATEWFIRKLFAYYGVRKIYVIDPHFSGHDWMAGYPIETVSALPLLKAAALKDFPEMFFAAPDAGSQKRTSLSGLKKTRQDSYTVKIHHDEAFADMVKGKDVGVVDDLIETGGTMARFAEKCKEYGARNITALVTHGVLPSGIIRIANAYSKLYLSNTIDREESNIDVSGLILSAIK